MEDITPINRRDSSSLNQQHCSGADERGSLTHDIDPHLANENVHHHDNVPDLTYSVDGLPITSRLTLRDYFLFPNKKKRISGRRFSLIDELKAETDDYFAEFEK